MVCVYGNDVKIHDVATHSDRGPRAWGGPNVRNSHMFNIGMARVRK